MNGESHSSKDMEKNVPDTSAPYDGLAVMDEIYEAGDISSFSSDSNSLNGDDNLEEDEADPELETALVELLDHVQDCMQLDELSNDQDNRITVDKAFADEAVNCLISQGTLVFLGKYLLTSENETEDTKHKVANLLAALGFRLPHNVVDDPKFTSQHFEIALQVAIRYTMSHRKRLPKPRTLDEVAEVIEKAQKIVVITGAGISTSLGIPDFRSDDGLYAQLEHLGLNDPQEVFDIRTFREDPSIFFSVAAKILPEEGLHVGTPTHKFIKLLNDKNKLLRNYTQNIDNIEQFVGIPHERVVQCHGSFGSAHCFTCGYVVPDAEELFPKIKQGEIPRCPECIARKESGKRKRFSKASNTSQKRDDYGEADEDEDEDEEDDNSYGVLKPDITFFGEALPARFDRMLFDEGDAQNCDLIICIGTSLRVSPVSEIVKVVPRQIPQIYISKTPAKHVTFELSFLGGCDDVVELLCQKLGWNLDHPMNKRSADLPSTEFPDGTIVDADGVFRFLTSKEQETERIMEQNVQQNGDYTIEQAAEHTVTETQL